MNVNMLAKTCNISPCDSHVSEKIRLDDKVQRWRFLIWMWQNVVMHSVAKTSLRSYRHCQEMM